ncbi:MAG TPA: GUN4 domain-containing protein, partial [Allocoleopsis sp.]
ISPNRINSNISDTINQAILQGMKLDYKERPQFVEEWLDLLDNNYTQNSTYYVNVSRFYKHSVTYINKNSASDNLVQKTLIGLGIFTILAFIFAPRCPANLCSSVPEPDYKNLEKMLLDKKFENADKETWKIIREQTNKPQWIPEKDLNDLSCNVVNKIDELWIKYSKGKFGFSIQGKMWNNLGGETGVYNKEISDKFKQEVGWTQSFQNMQYDISAPKGHLPSVTTRISNNFGVPHVAAKIENCQGKSHQ